MTAEPKFDYTDRLASDTKLLVQMISDVDHAVDAECWEDLDQGLICLGLLEEARTTLGHVCRSLTDKLAKSFPRDEKGHVVPVTIENVGTFKQSKKKDRTQWDKEALLSAVLDSRLMDFETGELIEETPLDRVLTVFNLPAPRITALRDRNIDADEFCHVEDAGYSIRLYQ